MINIKKLAFHQRYSLAHILIAYLIIMIFTVVVTIASILVFTSLLAPKIHGLMAIISFLSMPILYYLAYIYVSRKVKLIYDFVDKRQQYKIDLIQQIFKYIIIMMMLFFFFLLTLYYPLQRQGVNNEQLSINVQPYLPIGEISYYNENKFLKTQEIYSRYNISINFLSPVEINISTDYNFTELIFKQNCSAIEKIYNLTNKDSKKVVNVIFLKFNSSIEGMAYVCNKSDLAIIKLNNSMDGWVLAHELGHVLGAKRECWRSNLMKEYSRDCYSANWITHNFIRDLQPVFLNQKQVDTVAESAKNRFS